MRRGRGGERGEKGKVEEWEGRGEGGGGGRMNGGKE